MGSLPLKRILTINSGSSSLKMAMYMVGDIASLVLSGGVNRIGSGGGRLRMSDSEGHLVLDRDIGQVDQAGAFREVAAWLDQCRPGQVDAVGHRVVHGGRRFTEPALITDELIQCLQDLVSIDPDHTPRSIEMISLAGAHFPNASQVACFDTAFHRHLPRIAQMYALPGELYDLGIMRYGFHGLSYEYICGELARIDPFHHSLQAAFECGDSSPVSRSNPVSQTPFRAIIAHLGNGASMAAILDGKSIDTTMGFTPLSGLVMGSRCGDIDPGIVLHLVEEMKMTPQAVNTLLNQQSGLLGISGSSEDMRDLLNQEATDARAAEAIQVFCYSAKKYLGAYAAALGGLDTVVFTGGIGENAPAIRERICSGLDFLGIHIDAARNDSNAPLISTDDARVTVRVIKTNEDLMIARHCARVLSQNVDRDKDHDR